MTAVAEHQDIGERAPPDLRKPWTVSRAAGWLMLLSWGVAVVGLVWFLVNEWNIDKVERYGPKFISGLWVTIELVGISLIIGAILSLPVALGRMSRNPLLSRLAFAYVYVFRGTPLLAQLFLIYYGLGSFSDELKAVGLWFFFRDAWNCALFAFVLNTAAYQAEILRGAIESVPRGQWEGAGALGLNRIQTFWKVILPQALVVALRPYGNEIVLMLKGSAIVALVTVYDLMGETRRAFSRTYDFQAYIWAAVFYFVLVQTLQNIWNRIEVVLTRHLKR